MTMTQQSKLHSSIEEFKQFVKSHPFLVQEVRGKEKTWQEVYEEWLILGADHQQWLKYKRSSEQSNEEIKKVDSSNGKVASNSEESKDITKALLGFLSKYNVNDVQQHLSQFSGVLQNIQNIIQNFQGKSTEKPERNEFRDPFSFRRH